MHNTKGDFELMTSSRETKYSHGFVQHYFSRGPDLFLTLIIKKKLHIFRGSFTVHAQVSFLKFDHKL